MPSTIAGEEHIYRACSAEITKKGKRRRNPRKHDNQSISGDRGTTTGASVGRPCAGIRVHVENHIIITSPGVIITSITHPPGRAIVI